MPTFKLLYLLPDRYKKEQVGVGKVFDHVGYFREAIVD